MDGGGPQRDRKTDLKMCPVLNNPVFCLTDWACPLEHTTSKSCSKSDGDFNFFLKGIGDGVSWRQFE